VIQRTLEDLRQRLDFLKMQEPGRGAQIADVGFWLLQIAELNLAIAEFAMRQKEQQK